MFIKPPAHNLKIKESGKDHKHLWQLMEILLLSFVSALHLATRLIRGAIPDSCIQPYSGGGDIVSERETQKGFVELPGEGVRSSEALPAH